MLYFWFYYPLLLSSPFTRTFHSPCGRFIISFCPIISYWPSALLTSLLSLLSILLSLTACTKQTEHPHWEAGKWWKPQLRNSETSRWVFLQRHRVTDVTLRRTSRRFLSSPSCRQTSKSTHLLLLSLASEGMYIKNPAARVKHGSRLGASCKESTAWPERIS